MEFRDVLSQEEIDGCRDAFLAYDTDRSGTIDQWELREVLKSMGQNPTEEELFTMISEVDDNGSNSIDFPEFLQVMARRKLEVANQDDQDILDAWVAVGGDPPTVAGGIPGGFVDTKKLIQIVKGDFGLTIDIEELIREIDLDGSGTIDFEEFQQLLS